MNSSPITELPGEPTPKTLRTFVRVGHLFLLSTLAVWAIMYLSYGDPYDQVWQIILLTTFLGRATAVGAGLTMDFHPFFLFYQTAVTETIIVLYVFSAFVRGYQKLTQAKHIGGYLDSLHRVALSYKSRMAPYGIFGLMIFVVFPFWSTGPLVASIIGYLIGLPALSILVAVSIGNISAVALWVWLYDSLYDWNANAALALLALVAVLAIAGTLVAQIRKHNKVQ